MTTFTSTSTTSTYMGGAISYYSVPTYYNASTDYTDHSLYGPEAPSSKSSQKVSIDPEEDNFPRKVLNTMTPGELSRLEDGEKMYIILEDGSRVICKKTISMALGNIIISSGLKYLRDMNLYIMRINDYDDFKRIINKIRKKKFTFM